MRTPLFPLPAVYAGFSLLLPPVLVVSPKWVVPLLALATLLAAAWTWQSGRPLPRPDRVLLALFALILFWAGLSCLWSPDIEAAMLRYLRVALLLLAGLFLANLVLALDPEERARAARWLLIGFALGLVLLVTERLSGSFLQHLGSEPKAGKSLLSALNRGATGLAILVWPATLLASRHRLGRWALLLPVLVLALIATLESEAAVLALLTGLAFSLCAIWGRRLALSLLIALPVATTLVLPLASDWLYRQGLYDRGVISHNAEHRLHIWSFVSHHISEKPLFGWGFNGSRALPETGFEPFRGNEVVMVTHPHNAVLQVLVEFGWLGWALVLTLLLVMILRLDRLPRDERIAAQAVFVSAFTVACVSYGLWQSQWLATLLSAALVVLLCREGSAEPQALPDRPPGQP